MKIKNLALAIMLMPSIILNIKGEETVTSYTWEINSVTEIGGYSVSKLGDVLPEVVTSDKGDVVQFSANGALLIDYNPIEDAKEFTMEMIFKPEGTYYEPRVFHIGTAQGQRAMMEIRVTEDQWSLDGFLKTDIDDLTLLDLELKHPMNEWQHAAITYGNDTLKTYVNGVLELKDKVVYNTTVVETVGQTSIGARMNGAHWFEGKFKTVKVTHKVLDPSEFLQLNPVGNKTIISDNQIQIFPNPVNDNFYISNLYSHFKSGVNIEIMNMTGKIIRSLNTTSDNTNIITGDIESGIYFIKLSSEDKIFTEKLLINH